MTIKYYIYIFAALVLVAYYLYLIGAILANFESISAKEANDLLGSHKNDAIVLDVRTEDEFKNDGHIDGAILIPIGSLASQLSKLQTYKDKTILVYCRSGMRSVSASRILVNAGYKVYNLKGGVNGWKSSGYAIRN
jgi:rhodanese-related sulfurtransferase